MEALFLFLPLGIIIVLVVRVFPRATRPSRDAHHRPKEQFRPTKPPRSTKPRPVPYRRPQPSPPTPAPYSPATSKPAPSGTILTGRAYVVDGDTLKIRKTQIRLFGVDAPEMNHPFGKRAKWAMFELCKNQIVTAEITAMDDHGRAVAKCTLKDGRDLSAELVKQGLALDWAKYSGGVYRHLETPDARRKLWLADARQKGRMYVWEQFDARQSAKQSGGAGR